MSRLFLIVRAVNQKVKGYDCKSYRLMPTGGSSPPPPRSQALKCGAPSPVLILGLPRGFDF